jgi:hypothetical protein
MTFHTSKQALVHDWTLIAKNTPLAMVASSQPVVGFTTHNKLAKVKVSVIPWEILGVVRW